MRGFLRRPSERREPAPGNAVRWTALALGTALLMVLLVADPLLAQEPGATGAVARRDLRPYWHVFAAYAVAWLVLGGWAVAIFRRLGDVERELDR